MPAPLEGIRVADFSHALAGPYCTMLMAQYGAEVYKIESPEGGEVGRGWGPPFTGDDSSFFLGVNTGKRSLTIDLKKPEGLDLCYRIIERCDVLIENMRPGTFARLGLDYEKARARNPRLIYCAISGYGQNGPSRDNPAMDLIVQASSGLMSCTGTDAGELVRCGHSVADITSGMFALIGILMSLEARHRTGVGQFVDIAMMDAMISAMSSNYATFTGSGRLPQPMGSGFATIVPYRAYPCSDRDIVIAVASQKLWMDFCPAIGRPDLARNPDYADNPMRVKNRHTLEPIIEAIFLSNTCANWMERLHKFGIPCTPVRTLQETVDDPQAAAREMFPVVDSVRVTGPPVKFSATPGSVVRRAPRLGEHTHEALGELLGLDSAALDKLAASGAFG
jgi:crotonobetainyl-CoA:carnitine CoA-transferase CaiB-like acyl-CoA transferase